MILFLAGAATVLVALRRGPSTPRTLTVAVQADVTGLYPNLRNEAFTYVVNGHVFEGLTRLSRDLGSEPAVSDRWSNPDATTWLFHLRPGILFSDGTPVRAQDVVASLRFAQTALATVELMAAVDAVEATSPDEIRITTRYPFPVLPSHLSFALVVPEGALDRSAAAVGTGPFQVESWARGDEIVLEANPHFWGSKPDFPVVRFLVIPQPEDRVEAVVSGRADVADNVPASHFSDLAGRKDVEVVSRPGPRVLFLVLRVDRPPFANPLVREAIDVALDRGEIVRRSLGGFAKPAWQLVPAMVLGYDTSIREPAHDVARARRLMSEAGFAGGFDVTLEGPSNRYVNGPELMHEVARQLAGIGVRVAVHAIPKERFFPLVDTGRYEFLLYGWSCETVQAGEALDVLIRSPRPPRDANVAFFSDAKADALIDQANREASLETRARLLSRALARVAETRPVIPLVVQNESFVVSKRVEWSPALDVALRVSDVKPRGGAFRLGR